MKNHAKLLEIISAWHGIEPMANWLVETFRPDVIVDLGVDHGCSTCAFASAGIGKVYGIDHRSDILQKARQAADDLGLTNVELIYAKFRAVAEIWDKPVDILHIDGDHDYASVADDFAAWEPHLRAGGVLLMHDLDSFPDGPGRLFYEIAWPKWKLPLYCGVGILTKPHAGA